MNCAVEINTLQQGGGTSQEQAMALFDQLEPVPTAFMLGKWKGKGFNTQHRMDGLLEAYDWHGKVFESTESVHPLVFVRGDGFVKLNPIWFPLKFAKTTKLSVSPFAKKAFKLATYFLFTKKPRARLRMTEYRGKTSATMVYDQQPINDVFRKIDDNTVMGVMDAKGMSQPFFFILERE